MKQLINRLKEFLQENSYKKEMMRFAQSEFKHDWEYAYHVLLQGKHPLEERSK